MEEREIGIKLKNDETLLVPKQTLTEDSPKFRYLIEELNFKEIDIEDFSPEAVNHFLTLLEQKRLGEIEDAMFRELHKLAVVFEVKWLKESCRGWLKKKIAWWWHRDFRFIFDECWYIFDKWGEKCMVHEFVSDRCIIFPQSRDFSTLISEYLLGVDNQLKTGQMNILLKMEGSNTDLFLRIILRNVAGQRGLHENVKWLLQNINLALCCEQNEELYLEMFDTKSNLPEISKPDLQLTHRLITDTASLVRSRRERRITTTVKDNEKGNILVRSCMTLDDIAKALTEDIVISMFEIVELLLSLYHRNTHNKEDTQLFLTTLKNICSGKKLQKVSLRFLDTIIRALNYSKLEQSDQLTDLLNEIKNDDKLCTFHENAIIGCHKKITVSKATGSKGLFFFNFKHPGMGTCSESGSECGFILKQEGNTVTLCTNNEDYTNTGIHLHSDIISAHEMYWYVEWSGDAPVEFHGVHFFVPKVEVVGWRIWHSIWLSECKKWVPGQSYIAYNIADYVVAKPE